MIEPLPLRVVDYVSCFSTIIRDLSVGCWAQANIIQRRVLGASDPVSGDVCDFFLPIRAIRIP
jgi:hypothetical protein